MKSSIYNEDVYLNGNTDSFVCFRKMRKEIINQLEQEASEYSDTVFLFDVYISKIAEFLKSLDYNSSLEASLELSFLMNHGYLSKDLKFYPVDTDFELLSRPGISVLIGRGCCKNVMSIHHDIMKELDFSVKKLYCNSGRFHFLRKSSPANHLVNLIKHDDSVYAIDLCNDNKLFSFDNAFDLSEISLHSNFKLRYKPYIEFVMDEASLKEIRRETQLLELESKKPIIHPFYYEEFIKKNVEYQMSCQEDLCMDFHQETKQLREDIMDSYVKVKSSSKRF